MSGLLGTKLRAAVAGTALEEALERSGAPFLDRYRTLPAADFREGTVVEGLARVLATRHEAARFLAGRSSLLDRVRELDARYLERRGRELEAEPGPGAVPDLESFLDELRVLRREETVLAACLDLSGSVSFERVSTFLSIVAETVLRRAVAAARSVSRAAIPLCLIGMGKIGGREFTYYSDLDLLFLYQGEADVISEASRVARRVISYVSTMTPAGVAYAVDTRLRPSGQQGMLVTSFEAFERYQHEKAELWEHLALVRGRAVAGDRELGSAVLDRIRTARRAGDGELWAYAAQMRARVERERARERVGVLDFKTGPGGLMDLDFLAAAGALERSSHLAWPRHPSVPALLRAAAPGAGLEPLLGAYAFLRQVEARVRWVTGRGTDRLVRDDPRSALVAELLGCPSGPGSLRRRIEAARRTVRAAFHRVVEARTIAALGPGSKAP